MNKNIRLAKKQDIPALCDIWKHCFSDSDEYIRRFYSKNFERINVLAYYIDDVPVSMVHLIDASIESADMHQNAKFIYATGTLPEHRKKGCMGALLEALTQNAEEEGYALFLKPSTPNLVSYYGKFGFAPDSAFQLITLSPEKALQLPFYDLSCEEYNRMREAAFSDIPHAKWDDAHIQWCIEENELFSGRTLGIEYENRDYFILGYPEGNTLIIDETSLNAEQLKELSGFLCSIFDTESITAYLSGYSCEKGEKTISNLLYNSRISNPYINMILI